MGIESLLIDSQSSSDEHWMQKALQLADRGADQGEVPVGAVVVLDGSIIGRGWNQPISSCDPTAHAEIMALRDAASQMNNYRLPEAELFVTLEPCSMCAGAIVHSRIKRLIYATTEPKAGVVESQQQFFSQPFLNHQLEIVPAVLADVAREQLQTFFKLRRAQIKAAKERAKLST